MQNWKDDGFFQTSLWINKATQVYLSFCNRQMSLQNSGPPSQSSLMPSFTKAIWRGGGDPSSVPEICVTSWITQVAWSKKMDGVGCSCPLGTPGPWRSSRHHLQGAMGSERGPKGHSHLHRTAFGDLELKQLYGSVLAQVSHTSHCALQQTDVAQMAFSTKRCGFKWSEECTDLASHPARWKNIHETVGCLFVLMPFFLWKIQHLPQLIHTSSTKSKQESRLETKTKQVFCFGSDFILFFFSLCFQWRRFFCLFASFDSAQNSLWFCSASCWTPHWVICTAACPTTENKSLLLEDVGATIQGHHRSATWNVLWQIRRSTSVPIQPLALCKEMSVVKQKSWRVPQWQLWPRCLYWMPMDGGRTRSIKYIF